VLTWRAWVPDAAARLAQELEVQVDQVRPVLGELVEAQLEEFGLYAKDVQDQIAAWLEETGDG
jgi:energy-converting hydrogenase A subunit M